MERQIRCVTDAAAGVAVELEQARQPFEAGHLIRSWRRHAQRSLDRGDPFEAFIFDWIAFNGWAERVTTAERDMEWIAALGASPEIRRRFEEMKAENEEFTRACGHFADLWPIFRASAQRRLRIDVGRPRATVVMESLRAGIADRPDCYGLHSDGVPQDWPHMLHALYQVRCSLFHGEKGRQSDSDRCIVQAAVVVLSGFMSQSGYFT